MIPMEERVVSSRRIIIEGIVVAVVAILLVLGAVAMTNGSSDNDVIMSMVPMSEDAIYYGTLSIPNADIETELWRFHDGNACCFYGLFNGGRIVANTEVDWGSVALGDWAYISSEYDSRTILELVEIVDCIDFGDSLIGLHGTMHSRGDVLLCIILQDSPIVRIYRWTRL